MKCFVSFVLRCEVFVFLPKVAQAGLLKEKVTRNHDGTQSTRRKIMQVQIH